MEDEQSEGTAWSLELHSLKAHPGREHSTIFTGFQNLRERGSHREGGPHAEKKAEERKEELGKGRSGEARSTGPSPSSSNRGPSPSAGKSLIYEQGNRNRAGWLMPDESIPE